MQPIPKSIIDISESIPTAPYDSSESEFFMKISQNEPDISSLSDEEMSFLLVFIVLSILLFFASFYIVLKQTIVTYKSRGKTS